MVEYFSASHYIFAPHYITNNATLPTLTSAALNAGTRKSTNRVGGRADAEALGVGAGGGQAAIADTETDTETDIETDIVASEVAACGRKGRAVVGEVRRWWRSEGLALLQAASANGAGAGGGRGGGGGAGGQGSEDVVAMLVAAERRRGRMCLCFDSLLVKTSEAIGVCVSHVCVRAHVCVAVRARVSVCSCARACARVLVCIGE